MSLKRKIIWSTKPSWPFRFKILLIWTVGFWYRKNMKKHKVLLVESARRMESEKTCMHSVVRNAFGLYIFIEIYFATWRCGILMEGTYVPKKGWRLAEGRTHPEIWMPNICIFEKTSYLFQLLFVWSNFQWRQVKSDCRISYSFRFFPRGSKSNNLEMTVLLNKAMNPGMLPSQDSRHH